MSQAPQDIAVPDALEALQRQFTQAQRGKHQAFKEVSAASRPAEARSSRKEKEP